MFLRCFGKLVNTSALGVFCHFVKRTQISWKSCSQIEKVIFEWYLFLPLFNSSVICIVCSPTLYFHTWLRLCYLVLYWHNFRLCFFLKVIYKIETPFACIKWTFSLLCTFSRLETEYESKSWAHKAEGRLNWRGFIQSNIHHRKYKHDWQGNMFRNRRE